MQLQLYPSFFMTKLRFSEMENIKGFASDPKLDSVLDFDKVPLTHACILIKIIELQHWIYV